MFDGQESSPLTGTLKIADVPAPHNLDNLLSDLAHQSLDATNGHAQGDDGKFDHVGKIKGPILPRSL